MSMGLRRHGVAAVPAIAHVVPDDAGVERLPATG
jgi:hypothetical protein